MPDSLLQDSRPSPRKALYSRSWAYGVLYDMCRKYPRATEVVRELLQLTNAQWVNYLVYGDKLWPELRRFVKIVDNWQSRPGWQGWTPYTLLGLRSVLGGMYAARIRIRLDKLYDWKRIEEQGIKGGLGRCEITDLWPPRLSSEGLDGQAGPATLGGAKDAASQGRHGTGANQAHPKGQL